MATGASGVSAAQGGDAASSVGGAPSQGGLGSAGLSGAPPVLTGPDPLRTPPTFCSIDNWCGSNANFVAIWGSSDTDIWIVANEAGDISGTKLATNSDATSALLHWDGLRWSAVQLGEIHAIWGSSKDDVWAVGRSALFLHYDGKDWSPVHAPVGAPIDFTAVTGSSPTDVWAVGWGKTVVHFDGNAWTQVAMPTWDIFRSVWASANEVWVLGDQTMNHFDRSSWSSVARPPGSVQSGLWGRAEDEAWIAGQGGTLERWNSTGEQTNPVAGGASASNFRGLWGSSASDGWAVGEKGIIARWGNAGWSAGPHLTDSSLNAAWGYQGSTWFVGDNGAFLEFDGKNFLASPIATHKLNGLWGPSARDVWAAGREIVHWDGNRWRDVARPGSDEVLAVWGSSATDVWAAGRHGLFLHGNGTAWQVSKSPTNADINGIWGSSKTDVWAVDAGGHFLHFDGSAWSIRAALNFGPLESVWGRNALDVIAVGGSNRIHFDGVEWHLLPPHPSETPIYKVAFGNGELVWIGGQVGWSAYKAGGAHPELGRWNGVGMTDNLEPMTAPAIVNLGSSSVEAGWGDTEQDVWIYLSRLMHWDGAQWSYSAAGHNPITALWGTTTHVWALTTSGQILEKSR